eukprot:SAG22_NODE_2303_length_2736_cov_4.228669_5_plen_130_part_00
MQLLEAPPLAAQPHEVLHQAPADTPPPGGRARVQVVQVQARPRRAALKPLVAQRHPDVGPAVARQQDQLAAAALLRPARPALQGCQQLVGRVGALVGEQGHNRAGLGRVAAYVGFDDLHLRRHGRRRRG